MVEYIWAVTAEDVVVGRKLKEELTGREYFRAVALWITSPDGMILMAKRGDVKYQAGKWGPAVTGTVRYGEAYDDALVREAKEELGLEEITGFVKLGKRAMSMEKNYVRQLYHVVLDRKSVFTPDEREVAEVRWFTVGELEEMREGDGGELTTGLLTYLDEMFDYFEGLKI